MREDRRNHPLRCRWKEGGALLALGNEQEACSVGIEEHAVVGGEVRVAVSHPDRGDGRAFEGGLVDRCDRGRQHDRVGLAPGEGARADGDQGVLGAVVRDGLGKS